MTHDKAKDILSAAEAHVIIDEAAGTAIITGEVSIEELHAVLQLLEYTS